MISTTNYVIIDVLRGTIAFRFPPHIIELDGEPEIIKEFAAKQH